MRGLGGRNCRLMVDLIWLLRGQIEIDRGIVCVGSYHVSLHISGTCT